MRRFLASVASMIVASLLIGCDSPSLPTPQPDGTGPVSAVAVPVSKDVSASTKSKARPRKLPGLHPSIPPGQTNL